LRLREKQDNVLMPFLNGSLVGKTDDSSSNSRHYFCRRSWRYTDQEISPNGIALLPK
jgi:hypothetical protein